MKEFFKQNPWLVLLIVGPILLIVASSVTYLTLRSDSDTVAVITAPPEEAKKLDASLQLDALLRKWKITKACFDTKLSAYLVLIPKHEHIEGATDSGWYIIEHYNFLELENKTWFLDSWSDWKEVAPDVTGLQCKEQLEESGWYR